MDKSIDRIVKASDYPLSIVIVGVGTTDFTDMVNQLLTTILYIPYKMNIGESIICRKG